MIRIKLEECEKRVQGLERDKLRKNILIYKANFERIGQEHLEEAVITFMRDKLEVDLKPGEIDFINIINKNTDKPITVVGLTSWRKRNIILKNSKKLKRIFICCDYPEDVLEKRRKLLPEMKRLRKLGRYATINYDRLFTKNSRKEFIRKVEDTSDTSNSTKS